MRLSKRITGITGGGADGWGVFYRARAMQAAGVAITDLTIGEHDTGTDPAILDQMYRAARAGHTGYAAIPGTPELRAAIATRVAGRTGVPTAPGNVLVTPGGQSALFAAHIAACDPGDTALYVDPYYATYPGTIRSADARPVAVPAPPEAGFTPDFAALAAAAPGARSLLINSPNNPTGVVYDRATLAGIAEQCQAHALWLISDEVYETQVWTAEHLSPRALPGMANRTLVVGSMSKSFAMTGSRIGWLIGPEDAIAHLINLSTHTTYGVAGFVQDAALYALCLGPDFEARIAAPFRRRRALVEARLSGSNAIRVVPGDGTMYAMLDIRAVTADSEGFALRLLEDERIAVMPGDSFGRVAAGHLRVALTVADDRLAAALDTLVGFAERKAA